MSQSSLKLLAALAIGLVTVHVAACSRSDGPGAAPTAPTASTQGTVPPPPGDSTPIPADTATRQAAEGNEKTGASGPQTTVGTAAAGAPPYTLNGAPEGNTAPAQGSKAGEAPKK